ncbi:hypothetical protein J7T55_006840 [Diaporthe amygdali]|uniref:uncharacterized protein n=1 Tax=Phomopsis amygdali TaxID=1214568 RepID=UPI0022FEA147|nr:uncharacterized protein J7T55_006840 [Diaporthe amygdali]KAJ0125491.1 hypothetical protein J7T55_006840 [Diaporthe amygdali]
MADQDGHTTPRASPENGDPQNVEPNNGGNMDGTHDGGPKDGGPKTPSSGEKGKKNMTQIELTPIESLLFFNMVRFNGNHDKIDWNMVAAHSNLKNAASARVRFRQILKKHDLMDHAPETPRTQAQKRRAAKKPEEGDGEDDDGDSSYTPSLAIKKASARKRPARSGGGGRAKKQKAIVKAEDNEEEKSEEVVAESVVVSTAPVRLAEPGNKVDKKPEIEAKSKAESKPKTESEPDAGTGIALLNDHTVAGGVDGADSASPNEMAQGQASQAFNAAMPHLNAPGHRQSPLPANMANNQMMQIQAPYRGHDMFPVVNDANDLFGYGEQLDPRQLAAWQARQTRQPRSQQLTYEQRSRQMEEAQWRQYGRFHAMQQMWPFASDMGGMDVAGAHLPLETMAQMQMNEQYPANVYNGGVLFNHPQLGDDGNYVDVNHANPRAKLDGQDEREAEVDFERDIKEEVEDDGEAEEEYKKEEV